MGSANRQEWNCEVCRAIERWKAEGRPLLLLREILEGHGLYVVPSETDEVPNDGCYLVQIRFRDQPSTEIRVMFQTILASAEQTWIAESNQSVRVR